MEANCGSNENPTNWHQFRHWNRNRRLATFSPVPTTRLINILLLFEVQTMFKRRTPISTRIQNVSVVSSASRVYFFEYVRGGSSSNRDGSSLEFKRSSILWLFFGSKIRNGGWGNGSAYLKNDEQLINSELVFLLRKHRVLRNFRDLKNEATSDHIVTPWTRHFRKIRSLPRDKVRVIIYGTYLVTRRRPRQPV